MASSNGKPSIVFCHGIWADGSCFNKVIVPLQAAGYDCISAQYPLNTTADDIAIVKKTLSRIGSPAILVGHSYGGQVITGRRHRRPRSGARVHLRPRPRRGRDRARATR